MTEIAVEGSQIQAYKCWCTIVIPCYNEAKRLRTNCFSEFLAQGHKVRFLFVNDGSRDATLEVLERLQTKHPAHIHILDKQPNGGKAEAVRYGMLHAIALGDADYTGFWDADLATPLDAILELLNELVEQPKLDMVFGARVRLLGRSIHRKALRHYLGRAFATFVSLMLKLPIYDTQCGAKIFRITPDLRFVLASPFQSRWIFDVEILARFLAIYKNDPDRLSNLIYESPLRRWEDVAGSKVGALDFFKAIGELVRIRNTYLH